MSAYCVFLVREISDPVRFAEYRRGAAETVTRHGGSFLAAGGQCDALEQAEQPIASVIIEFPDLAAAKDWYDSEDYEAFKQMRLTATSCEAFFMEGLPAQAIAAQ